MATLQFEVYAEDAAAIGVSDMDVVHVVRLPADEVADRHQFLVDEEWQRVLNILYGVLNGLDLSSTRAAKLAAAGEATNR